MGRRPHTTLPAGGTVAVNRSNRSKLSKRRNRIKPGKKLEELVAWIEGALRDHETATVTANERLVDRDTGEPRQIDVVVRVKSGHDTWLGIVEVRDRSRPVDSRYIEEVVGKRDSVGAAVAYIVSKEGFYEPAIKKANRHGIRLLTLDEAEEHDWSAWCGIRDMQVLDRAHDRAVVTLGRVDGDTILHIHDDVIAAVNQDKNAMVLTDIQGVPIASLATAACAVINHFANDLYKDVPVDGSVLRKRVLARGPFKERIFVRNTKDEIEEIGAIRIDADFFHKIRSFPVTLRRYRRVEGDGGTSLAEVVEADLEMGDKTVRVEMLAETDGASVGGERALQLRTTVIKPGA